MLGLDPGTRTAGYGLVEVEGTRLRFLDAGTLTAVRGAPLEDRLATIATGLRALCESFRPTAAAVEDVFVKADPKAALAVGHGRGALLAVLGEQQVRVHSYAPASIKRALTGNGRARKEQVAKMVSKLLGTGDLPTDATDALAAAVAHAFASKAQMLADQ
ncbi:MAG: crossover junction endodeoxyribonuclease RuvC [Planctomycetota bacterium]